VARSGYAQGRAASGTVCEESSGICLASVTPSRWNRNRRHMSSRATSSSGHTGASQGSQELGGLRLESARGRLLQAIVALFDAESIPYCILHGYQEYPARVVSDVDCIIPAEFLPRQLARLLRVNRDRLGAAVVQWIQHESTAHYFVLATNGVAARWEFLAVDVASDNRQDGRVFYRGEEILASRRQARGFWIPSPALEFGYYLVKKVAKRSLEEEHGRRLTELYNQDPTGCEQEIARWWSPGSARPIGSGAASGRWEEVRELLPSLRRELLWPGSLPELRSSLRYWAADGLRRFRRWRLPTGVHVVLLGADGSGKSTTLRAVGDALAPVFRRVISRHLAPGLFHAAPAHPSVTAPHSRPPRSLVGSLAKAAYWGVDYTLGYYLKIRPALARSTLVLFDRYLIDALVDPRRYRYGGPRWVLHLVWSLIPKPDLVILLDAPPEALQTRKQEVSLAESTRQGQAYRQVMAMLPEGHIVDAAQPLGRVVAAVSTAVLAFLASRTMRRLGDIDHCLATGRIPSIASFDPKAGGGHHRAASGPERNPA
jgi:thymidylate kinase